MAQRTASRRRQKTPESYRHGDLRNALLKQALALIESRKEVTFTIREIAAAAGVSHAAAYRHFKSKREILGALAADGFSQMQQAFAASLVVSAQKKTSSARELAKAYVTFAVTHPGSFRVMFHPDLKSLVDDSELEQSSMAAFGTLVECMQHNQKVGRFVDRPTEDLVVVAWSLVHGLSTLLVNESFPANFTGKDFGGPATIEAMAQLLELGLLKRY